MKIRLLLFTLVGVGFAVLASAQEVTRGPYVQMVTPDSIVVVWRTDEAIKPVVRYGEKVTSLRERLDGDSITLRVSSDVARKDGAELLYAEPEADRRERTENTNDRDPSTAENSYQYEARITGLEAGRTYYYAVHDGRKRLAGGDDSYRFTTSPIEGTAADLRIWVVGDSGTGGRLQKQVHEAMLEYVDASDRALDMYIHVGDMAYGDGTDREFQRNFFDVYEPTLRNTVCWPAMGNHEGHTSRGISGFGPYYDAYVVPTAAEAGGLPSGTEAYYSFRVGSVHFICLDSHDLDRTPTGAMARWLTADLDQAKGDWLIAFWHHPPYTKGSHDSDREGQLIEMRTHIMPILEAGGVDVVLTGHSHIYERSMLMDGAYSTPTTADGVILDDGDGRPDGDGPYLKSAGLHPHEGTVQIVAGHGGASLSRKGTMPVMREIILEHGSVLLDLDGDTLVGRMVNRSNDIRDVFSIVKRGEVTVSRIEDPWQPDNSEELLTEFTLAFDQDTIGESPAGFELVVGDGGSFSVEKPEDVTRRVLQATAGDDPAMAVYEDFSRDGYKIEFVMNLDDATTNQVAGLVVGYQDSDNYYVVKCDAAKDTISLCVVEGGHERVLAEQSANFAPGSWFELEVTWDHQIFDIQIEDNTVIGITDGTIPDPGRLGYWLGGNSRAMFSAINVELE